MNWRWIVKTLRRIVVPDSTRARINAVLNGTLFIMMTITLFSGLAISEVVMPLAGVTTSTLRAWQLLHNVLASPGLGVVGFHVALNWDWIAGVVRKGILLRTLPGVTAPLSPDGLATAEAEDARATPAVRFPGSRCSRGRRTRLRLNWRSWGSLRWLDERCCA